MDFLERVLDEQAGDLTRALEEQAGFSATEAQRFVRAAGRALIASYEWNRLSRRPIDLHDEDAAGDLLAVIHGRALAAQLRLSAAKTWTGLRVVVPIVVEASAPEAPAVGSRAARTRRVRISTQEAAHLEVGLGLRTEAPRRHRRGGPTIAE
jgi:hypothetical protein